MTPTTHAKRLARLLALCAATLPLATSAATLTWTGGAGSPFNWSGTQNWGGQTLANGDNLVFTGTVGITNVNDLAGLSLGSLTFQGASAWTLGVGTDKAANAISLSDGISLEGTGSVSIASNITLTAAQTFSNTATNNRTLGLGPDNAGIVLDIGSHNLTLHSTASSTGYNTITLNYGGNLIGSGTLTITGGGIVLFRGNGTGTGYGNFTGNIVVSEGSTLRAFHNGALGTTAGTTTIASGATLLYQHASNLSESITAGGDGVYYSNDKVQRGAISLWSTGSLTGAITLSETTSVGFRYANTLASITGSISESTAGSGLSKVGSWVDPSAGFLKLTNASIAYTGVTTVKGGGLVINGTHGSASNRVSGYAVTHETLSQVTSGVTGGITSQSVLAGTGTVYLKAGEKIVVSGASSSLRANFAPGDITAAVSVSDFTSAIGTFTVNAGDAASGVTLGDFSQFSVQIGAAGASDRLVISNGGGLAITGDSLLSITGTLDTAYTYTIAQFGSVAGTFSQVTGLAEGWSVVYNPTSIDLVYGAIPEPASLALLAGAPLLGFALLRRRSRR